MSFIFTPQSYQNKQNTFSFSSTLFSGCFTPILVLLANRPIFLVLPYYPIFLNQIRSIQNITHPTKLFFKLKQSLFIFHIHNQLVSHPKIYKLISFEPNIYNNNKNVQNKIL